MYAFFRHTRQPVSRKYKETVQRFFSVGECSKCQYDPFHVVMSVANHKILLKFERRKYNATTETIAKNVGID